LLHEAFEGVRVGAVIGGMVAFYLIGKLLEWTFIKRVVRSYSAMVWLSSIVTLAAIALLWYARRDEAYAFHPAMFIDYTIAAILLPIIRIVWRRRKKPNSEESTA
jgi:hypothetical protein